MPSEETRPGIAGFVIGGTLIAAGIGLAIWWVVHGFVAFGDEVDRLQRVPVGEQRVLRFDSGRHAIYYEGPSRRAAVRVRLRPLDGATPVTIESYGGRVTYSISGHSGHSVWGFDVARPGRYAVASEGPSDGTLAIGRGLGHRIVRAIVGAIVIFLIGLALGGGLMALTAVRRDRAP